jgi:hypothetical protein
MTPLDKPLKRALRIDGRDYIVSIAPDRLKISLKGHRKGIELEWTSLVSGETALAVALHASVGQFQNTASVASRTPKATSGGSRKSRRGLAYRRGKQL